MQSDKKVSFDDPQNGGHFSCRKPVSHVGTSTELPVHRFVLANGQSSCVGGQAPHGSDRRFLRDECQSSRGVWSNLDLLHFFRHCRGVGVGKGWNRYQQGYQAVEVLAQAPLLNVQSGHSKVRHPESSCAAMDQRWLLQTNTTEILHVGTFAGHMRHQLSRSLWWKEYRPRVRSLGELQGTK